MLSQPPLRDPLQAGKAGSLPHSVPALRSHARAIWTEVVGELEGWRRGHNLSPGSLGGGIATLLGNLAEATSIVLAVSWK